MTDKLLFKDYAEAFAKHYPDVLSKYKPGGLLQVTKTGVSPLFHETTPGNPRFNYMFRRKFGMVVNALHVFNTFGYSAATAYKGLACLKPPTDLVLYTSLLWELQPKTIIELGSFQGGSGLWFADHLEVLCGHGEVHSFEKFIKCVSPLARHDRLTFHEVELNDLSSFDDALFERLEHPWVVIDDAHTNIHEVFRYLNKFTVEGDYYVIEDNMTMPSKDDIDFLLSTNDLGYRVDSHYTDACGYNNTSAPNAWLRKGAP